MLDSVIEHRFQGDNAAGQNNARLVSVLIHSERGEDDKALLAVRGYSPLEANGYLAVYLKAEADIALRMNDRETAIRKYSRYIELRKNADPEVMRVVEDVRKIVADLTAERATGNR